jgi:Na+/alanine symporter
MANERKRGPFLTVMAVLFAVLALSNATKALQHLQNPKVLGVVIFGVRFETVASNLILGLLTGLVLAAYSYGLWKLKPWVVPLSMAYAFYVPVNLVLFWYRQTGPEIPPLGSILAYLAVALTGSIGTALYLAYHRDRLA